MLDQWKKAIEKYNKRWWITKVINSKKYNRELNNLAFIMKGFMDTLHSKISTKTHAKVEEVRVNVVDINEKVERLMTQHEEFKNDINTQLNFIKQQSTNIYENLSTQNAMIRGLEYHQLKMQEWDEDIFDLKAKYSKKISIMNHLSDWKYNWINLLKWLMIFNH